MLQPQFSEAVRADTWRLYGRSSWPLVLRALIFESFFRPIFTHRLYHASLRAPAILRLILRPLIRWMHKRITARRCMQLPLETIIGSGLWLNHAYGVVVSKDAVIGANVTILHQVTIGSTRKGVPIVGGYCTLAAGSIVIGNVELGTGCTIGAGAVVVKSVPSLAVVVGNPSRQVSIDSVARTPNAAPLSNVDA
jgi:serine O-acetyltransferase